MLIFIVAGALLTAGAWRLGPAWGWGAGLLAVILTGWCVWFFRDPQRRIPTDPDLVLSAADGVVMRVEACPPPEELEMGDGPVTRIVVFLNVFNVHVNRAPMAGEVVAVARKGGLFAHAGKPAAELNARCSLALKLSDGSLAAVTQVTGLIARRIINRAARGQRLRAGERFGLIRFGSRTDVYLPAHFTPAVRPGEKVVGGVTVIARRRSA